MIITCPNCKKRFNINPSLMPSKGRDLQCGSCELVWFYKIEEKNPPPLTLKEDINNNEVEANLIKDDIEELVEDKKSITSDSPYKKKITTKKILDTKRLETNKVKKKNTGSKFFSYLIVLIISFAALIIILDTIKNPLINLFPDIEIILFNLFETLEDIKLFIIDLS
jgi:predicted Zn finger-like uncharacterized protein